MKKFSLIILLVLTVFASCKKPDAPDVDNTEVAVIHNNVSYGTNSQQKMDVYLPANRHVDSTKVFIYIHGGSWSGGDKSEFVNFYNYMKDSMPDYAFISLNYRLYDANTGYNRFPTQENDIQLAVDFIKSKSIEWQISEKVVISGSSAGGHLCLLHGLKNNNDNYIKAIISYFPPTELESFYSYNWYSTFVLYSLLNGTPQEQPELYYNSSPINYVTANSVPTLLLHGESDDIVPISQSYLLEQKFIDLNVPHNQVYYPGEGHGFSTNSTLDSWSEIMDFLAIYNS